MFSYQNWPVLRLRFVQFPPQVFRPQTDLRVAVEESGPPLESDNDSWRGSVGQQSDSASDYWRENPTRRGLANQNASRGVAVTPRYGRFGRYRSVLERSQRMAAVAAASGNQGAAAVSGNQGVAAALLSGRTAAAAGNPGITCHNS